MLTENMFYSREPQVVVFAVLQTGVQDSHRAAQSRIRRLSRGAAAQRDAGERPSARRE